MLSLLQQAIPSLSNSQHKGQMGKLGFVGGSQDYTGAPYFCAMSALHCGADLAHIFCFKVAAPIIKSYSPDLIIHPLLDGDFDQACDWISKMHAVTFGPGFGLHDVEIGHSLGKPIIIDADALRWINMQPHLVSNNKKVILTPNVVEFTRLYESMFCQKPDESDVAVKLLATKLGGVTIVRKGYTDVISDGEIVITYSEDGSPRRCGGQGDVLSGSMLTFSNWFHQSQEKKEKVSLPYSPTICAALAGCALTRKCSKLAFSKYGRSLVTAQMLPEIQHTFEQLFPNLEQE